EAVIRTGRAERVILQTGEGTFRPRLVTTGLSDSFGEGGRTEIVQGLAPGDTIVASAHFLIDSESALSAGLMRFAPTEAAPAAGRGEIVAKDGARRQVTLRHERIEALDWPAMTTTFTAAANVDLTRFAPGDAVRFELVRGADGLLALASWGRDDGIEAVGTGMVRAVTPDGKLDLAHDPIPALGWPAMEMEMPVAGLDPESVPTGVPVEFDLAKGDGGLFVVVGVRAEGGGATEMASEPAAAPPITVEGTIEAVDADARTARIAHGPIMEIGMPGMTMDFPLADGLAPADVPDGDAVLTIGNDPARGLILIGVEPKPSPMRVLGTVNAVDPAAGTANVTHGPLAEIGMPGMTMDFPMGAGLDPAALPVGEEVGLLIAKGEDFSLTLVGIEAKDTQ
ncbi:MAG: copper-binding protein, partial [Pseudomonadota bacterium]